MAKFAKISNIKLHIIKAIRNHRIALQISGEELSREISKTGNLTIVSNIENPTSTHAYSDFQLKRVARYFTQKSPDTIYRVSDFFPDKPFKEELVPKKIPPIKVEHSPTRVLEQILANTAFMKTKRSIREIAQYADEHFGGEWKTSDFTATLERYVEKGKVERLDEGEHVRYRQKGGTIKKSP